ncbi:11-beta-hydroxysteroid dehydrogenase 1B-like [Cucurbita moschata]|uniref:11-beta-hydroxysteroid dehydrogenase 1B-like n=1 Tax=Cucurbita moschata TaxID=3662 RepID=A0A6J1EAX4_CUCMO|nr:11-beta-hydroxysteroid dehydrogenase 1B-like [Cucurbita moschata]
MNILHTFLNLVAPPFTFISLFLLLPPYQAFKSFLSLIGFLFTENVDGKVVLITGASSGIGEHLAYEYAKRGACLVLVARRENLLEEVADIARYYGSPDVITIRADVSKFEDCRRVMNETMNRFGRLDHLVNNAAITHLVMFEDIADIAAFRQIMDINYWGAVYLTHMAIPYLRYSRGKIVALSAPPAWMPAPRMSIYNSSKAAIKTMFETLRVELAPEIGVTIVTPGFVESELTKGKALNAQGKMELRQDMRDALIGLVPVETAEACAKAVVKGICRGQRYVTEPSWYDVLYYWKAFCPEIVEWCYRILAMPAAGASESDALTKQALDYTGAKYVMYPSSIRSAGGGKAD